MHYKNGREALMRTLSFVVVFLALTVWEFMLFDAIIGAVCQR